MKYERTAKEYPLDIPFFEWDMAEFCFGKLKAGKGRYHQPDWNLLIEGFLLHYRNLIRFFSGENHHEAKGDLSTARPEIWAGRKLTEEEIKDIQVPARALDAEHHQKISQYLQHCTIRRMDPAEWNLEKMRAQLRPIVVAFERSFPQKGKPNVNMLARDANSTATFTVYKATKIT